MILIEIDAPVECWTLGAVALLVFTAEDNRQLLKASNFTAQGLFNKFSAVMEPTAALPCSKELATGLNSEKV